MKNFEMKTFKLDDNGHKITVKPGNRGLDDDYAVQWYEDDKPLSPLEYYNRDCLEWHYDISLDD